MSYLLLIPLVTFVALSVLTRENHAHSNAGRLLTVLLLGLAVAAAGGVILGSTPDSLIATIGATLSLTGTVVASVLLPVIPLAFAYGRLPRRGATSLRGLVAIAALLLATVLLLTLRSTQPLLITTAASGYQLAAPTAHPAVMVDNLIAVSSALLTGGIIVFLLLRGHATHVRTGWLAVVALWALAAIHVFDSHLGRWVSLFLLAGVFAGILATFRRARRLRETLGGLYANHRAGLMVLDERGRAVWLNSQASHMLGVTVDGPRLNPALLFAGTPYASVWQWAEDLPAAQAIRRFQIEGANSTQVLYAYVEPLPHQADLASGRAIRLTKTTPSDPGTTPILYETALTRARTAAQLGLLEVRLTASLDVAETLDLICQQALEIFETDGVYIWLKEGEELVGAAALGQGHQQFVGTHVSIDDPMTVGARVVRDKKPQFVNHAELASINQELVRLTGCKSLLGVPLFKQAQAIGSMMLVSTQDADCFSQTDLETANLLSTHAALAIDSARLFEKANQQVRQLRLVQEVGRDVSSHLDLDLLLAAVARRLWSAFGYYAVIIVVRDGNRLVPRVLMRRGDSLKIGSDTPLTIEEHGLIGTAARQGRSLLTPDVSKEPLFLYTPVLPDTKAELTIPLILAGEVLGVLDVQSNRPGGLTQVDLDLLQPLAAQITISISNAQLFQALRDYTAELETRVNERTQRVREQQERITAILRSVGDGVAVVNLDGQIILTNPQADALLHGQGRSPALGQQIRETIHDLAGQAESSAERRIDAAELSVEARATKLVEAGNVQGTVVVLRDITRLQEIDQLKSEFVSKVSHELRTPMANLKLYLQLLQQGKLEDQPRYIDTMEREMARLEHLIDDLLDLSRLDDPNVLEQTRGLVDLNSLVRQVMTNHEPRAETKRVSLQARLDETLPPVLGSRNQLIQVLTNLISNALAYTPEGGDVWIRSATQSGPQEDAVVITVEDSGVGISPDELDLVFDRFYRGKNAGILNVPGSGLGLSIVKEIVELHRGSISVSSAIGVGSTFTLTLPI